MGTVTCLSDKGSVYVGRLSNIENALPNIIH